MKKLLFILAALAAPAFGQITVQKASGTNQISNGPVVVGSGNSITATGTGSIIATGGNATSIPFSGITSLPAPAITLSGNATGSGSATLGSNVTLNVVSTTFAGLSGKPIIVTTPPLTGGGTLGPLNLGIPKANTTTSGYLDTTDWNTFNNKGTGTVSGNGTTGQVAIWANSTTIGGSNVTGAGLVVAQTSPTLNGATLAGNSTVSGNTTVSGSGAILVNSGGSLITSGNATVIFDSIEVLGHSGAAGRIDMKSAPGGDIYAFQISGNFLTSGAYGFLDETNGDLIGTNITLTGQSTAGAAQFIDEASRTSQIYTTQADGFNINHPAGLTLRNPGADDPAALVNMFVYGDFAPYVLSITGEVQVSDSIQSGTFISATGEGVVGGYFFQDETGGQKQMYADSVFGLVAGNEGGALFPLKSSGIFIGNASSSSAGPAVNEIRGNNGDTAEPDDVITMSQGSTGAQLNGSDIAVYPILGQSVSYVVSGNATGTTSAELGTTVTIPVRISGTSNQITITGNTLSLPSAVIVNQSITAGIQGTTAGTITAAGDGSSVSGQIVIHNPSGVGLGTITHGASGFGFDTPIVVNGAGVTATTFTGNVIGALGDAANPTALTISGNNATGTFTVNTRNTNVNTTGNGTFFEMTSNTGDTAWSEQSGNVTLLNNVSGKRLALGTTDNSAAIVLIGNAGTGNATVNSNLVVTGNTALGAPLVVTGGITGTTFTGNVIGSNISSTGNVAVTINGGTGGETLSGNTSTLSYSGSTATMMTGAGGGGQGVVIMQNTVNTTKQGTYYFYGSSGSAGGGPWWSASVTSSGFSSGDFGFGNGNLSTIPILTIKTSNTGPSRIGINTNSPVGVVGIAGNQTASSWTTSGIELDAGSATFTNSSTGTAGTATEAGFVTFHQPTLAATNTTVTTTTAATVTIDNAPANGTNNTITTPLALNVKAGNVQMAGALSAGTLSLSATSATANIGVVATRSIPVTVLVSGVPTVVNILVQ